MGAEGVEEEDGHEVEDEGVGGGGEEDDVVDVGGEEAPGLFWAPSPCHRLDVGTGGLLLVAKTRQVVCMSICGHV